MPVGQLFQAYGTTVSHCWDDWQGSAWSLPYQGYGLGEGACVCQRLMRAVQPPPGIMSAFSLSVGVTVRVSRL